MWFFTHFLHLLPLVLTFLSFISVPLYDRTPYFITFLIHFNFMLHCCILSNKYEALFLFVANWTSIEGACWEVYLFQVLAHGSRQEARVNCRKG